MSKTSIIDRDHGWIAFFRRVKEIEGSYVKVGVLDDGKDSGGDLTVGQIAVVNEFGTETVPARSFVRSTFDSKREEMTALGQKLIGAVVDGKMQTKKALDVMGAKLSAAMKLKITDGAGVPPPNAPSTVAKKQKSGPVKGVPFRDNRGRFSKTGMGVRPLVDTGRLLNSITYVAIVGGDKGKE